MTRLLTASLALAALGAFGGCLANNGDESLFISRVLSPETCTFTASADEPFLGSGLYKIGAEAPYIAPVQIESRISATAGNEVQRTVQLRGARVTLSFPDKDNQPDVDAGLLKFRTLFSGPVSPNGGLTDVYFPIVTPAFAKALSGTKDIPILANIEIYGELGGDEVTSQTFVFPITMSAAVGAVTVGDCPLLSSVTKASCFGAQQDTYIPCCTKPDNTVMCAGDSTGSN